MNFYSPQKRSPRRPPSSLRRERFSKSPVKSTNPAIYLRDGPPRQTPQKARLAARREHLRIVSGGRLEVPQLKPRLRHSQPFQPGASRQARMRREDLSGKSSLAARRRDVVVCLFPPAAERCASSTERGRGRGRGMGRGGAPRLTLGVTRACDVNRQTDFVTRG